MADELIRRMALASCSWGGSCDCRKVGIAYLPECLARATRCLSAAGVDELVKALEAARNHINNLSNSRAQSFTGNMLAQIDAALSLAKGGDRG